MNFWQTIVLALISSSFAATIIGSGFTFFINRKLDRFQRTMEVRKNLYSEIIEELAGFYDTASLSMRQSSSAGLLKSYRQVQLWASAEVVQQFNIFLQVFDQKNGKTQEEIGTECAKLICAMRRDLTGEGIDITDLHRYGRIH